MENTDIAATTIHALFEFDGDYQTKLDFTKIDNKKVAVLCELNLLLLDEVSMTSYLFPKGLFFECVSCSVVRNPLTPLG